MRQIVFASLVIAAAACSAPEASEAQGVQDHEATRPVNAPAWVRVDGVAQDDVLNVRAEPHAGSAIVDALDPGQGPVEIVATHQDTGGQWGLIATREGSGWINLAFTTPVDLEMIMNSPVPVRTICAGTEPFWSLRLNDEEAVFSNFEVEDESFPIAESESAMSRPYPWMFGLEGGGVALLTPEQCSDGMSDLPYAWSILLVLDGGTGRSLYEGCCRLRTWDEAGE